MRPRYGRVRRRHPLRVAVVIASVLSLAFTNHVELRTTVVSRDPYTNTDAFHEAEVVSDTFSFGSTIVSGFEMAPNDVGSATNIGFASSSDGGGSWIGGGLPGTTVYADPPGPYQQVVGRFVAYDAKHGSWLIIGIGLATCYHFDEVFVSRSTDDGKTWENPTLVSKAPDCFGFGWTSSRIVCDNWPSSPFYGTCYAEWSDLVRSFEIHMSRSIDGGLTWQESSMPNEAIGVSGAPVVQPNGTVVTVVDDEYIDPCCTYVSRDGGVSFTGPYYLPNQFTWHLVGGHLSVSNTPSAAVDASGRIYLVLFGCDFRPQCASNDILLAVSTDGRHWPEPHLVPIDPLTSSADHFMPGIAVEPGTFGATAHLAVTYWAYTDAGCADAACQLSAGLIQSLDGGATWQRSARLGGPFRNTWFPFVGGYYAVQGNSRPSFVPGGALSVFPMAKASPCQLGENNCAVAMVAPSAPVVR